MRLPKRVLGHVIVTCSQIQTCIFHSALLKPRFSDTQMIYLLQSSMMQCEELGHWSRVKFCHLPAVRDLGHATSSLCGLSFRTCKWELCFFLPHNVILKIL